MKYIEGQRWFSETEPELGLGIISGSESKQVRVYFPLIDESRIYNAKNSPLKRFILDAGDAATSLESEKFLILEVIEENGIIFYRCADGGADQILTEMNIHAKIDLNGPQDRVMAGNFDSNPFFDLRYQAYLEKRSYQSFVHKGFLGPNIRLIPHQIYVTHEVLKMSRPKVMLCDEVGLGKTIEAALVLHSLYQKELVKKTLIIVPESLVFQWFVELYKKFNMVFTTVNSENFLEQKYNLGDYSIVSAKILNEEPQFRQELTQKKWDMLIVDESHQINFKETENPIANLIKEVNKETYSTLFLSATPEVMGEENLFQQLQVLDPIKYKSFSEFQSLIQESFALGKLIDETLSQDEIPAEVSKYISKQELASFTSTNQVAQALIDRFGTGRGYFRNSRSHLEKYSRLFTERKLIAYPLNPGDKLNDTVVYKAKLMQLFELMQSLEGEKILVICHSRAIVLKLYKDLTELCNIKMGFFHSGQSLLERDRQAAFFAEEDGAQVLLCTEVGAEGRNFEFSQHLFLFDLPKVPDQLEQRIGRLDRIGQEKDVNIHVPFIAGSFEEVLFSWYDSVLKAFTSSAKGAGVFYSEHKEALVDLLESDFNKKKLSNFILENAQKFASYQKLLEEGRDHLVEMHSYNNATAMRIISEIEHEEKLNSPQPFLENLFDKIGIDLSDLNENSYFIKPADNMLIPVFPGLATDGLGFTYDRQYVIMRNELSLLSKEHPIYAGALDIVTNGPLGNASIATQEGMPRDIYFEFIIGLQCTDKYKFDSSRFLPFTPIRVLINSKQEDVTKKFPKKLLDQLLEGSVNDEYKDLVAQFPKTMIKELFAQALKIATPKSSKYQEMAIAEAMDFFTHEITRAKQLGNENLDEIQTSQEQIRSSIKSATISIDAVRIILPEE